MKNSKFFPFLTVFLCFVFASFGLSARDIIDDFEHESQTKRKVNETKTHQFLILVNDYNVLGEDRLTQDEIAEALFTSQSTVQKFLSKKASSDLVVKNLSFYYAHSKKKFSELKKNDKSDLDFNPIKEDEFIKFSQDFLWPKKLRDPQNIKEFLYELIGNDKTKSSVLAKILGIQPKFIKSFFDENDRNSFKPIYTSLRKYYRVENQEKLEASIREEIENIRSKKSWLSRFFH